jgi:DNA-binding CsgD family transcriptional regulator/tetratricopeptide (TPR) repeat protein
MVGRAAELAAVRRLLDDLAEPRVVLIGGPAGVGKTRLVQELLGDMAAGLAVLWGHAEQGALGRPWGLLLEAVEARVAEWDAAPEDLAARVDPLRLLLAPVAPRLGRPAERDYASEELLRAAVDLVGHLTRPGGAVVVFEDLQWADAESLAVFSRLALTPALPVLLVGTYRSENLDRRRLADVISELERRRSVQRIELAPLGRDEVGELLAAATGTAVPLPGVEAIHQRTGGNPFFVEELLLAAGDADPATLARLPLPASLTEAVVGHLDGLGPEERRTVDAAAILGHTIRFEILASLTGLDEDALIGVLRVLVERGLLVEPAPDVFAFRHDLTREAVTSRLLGRERRRLHERALEAMEAAGSDDWSALAHHAAAAGRFDDLVAVARAGAGAYLRAGATLQALALAELGLEEAGGDLELLELAARAAWSVDLRRSAIDRAEQWRRLAVATGDDRSLVGALRLLTRLRYEEGQREEQGRLTAEALEVAERLGPSEELAAAYSLMAETSMLSFREQDAIDWARRALTLADETGAAHLRPAILVNEGSAISALPGRWEEGAARLEEATTAALAQGDVVSALRGLNNMLSATCVRWPAERTAAAIDRMEALVEGSGRLDWIGDVAGWRAVLAGDVLGDLPSARSFLTAAHKDVLASARTSRWWMVAQAARLAFEAGAPDAGDLFEAAWQRAAASGHQEEWFEVHTLAAEIAARAGDRREVIRCLDEVVALLEQGVEGHGMDWWADSISRALRAAVTAGIAPDVVRGIAARVADARSAEDPHLDPAWPAHLEGALLEAEGDPEGAAKAYTEALADHGRHRWPPMVADVHEGLARCLLALGRADEAKGHADESLRLLERWPGWRRTEAETLLRRLGGGAAGGRVTGAEVLTPRESEVASLVAEGLSNGEIGRRLYISTKTASVHVSNILAKLNMSSRAEIAAWVGRQRS